MRHQRLLRVGLLLRAGIRGRQPGITFQIEARVRERRFILRLLGDRLIELRLVGARVDFGKHEAAGDVLPFLEGHLHDLPADLRTHRDGVECFHIADRIEVDRHVGVARSRDQHRRRLVLERARAPLFLLLLLLAIEHIGADRDDDRDPDRNGQNATKIHFKSLLPPQRAPRASTIADLLRQHPAAAQRLEQAHDRLQS